MRWVKQSQPATLMLGPFIDEADGKTPLTGLSISASDVQIHKASASGFTAATGTSHGHVANGYYKFTLAIADLNQCGPLTIAVNKSGALPVWHETMVLTGNAYDSIVLGTDYLVTFVNEIDTDGIQGGSLEDGAITKIQSGLATSAALATVDTVVDAIKAVTDDLADGERLDSILDAILADTNELQTDDVPGLISSLSDHGDSTWATATGFSTHSAADVRTAIGLSSANLDTQLSAISGYVDCLPATLDGSTFTALPNVTTDAASRTASKADVSGLATSAELAALETHGDETWATGSGGDASAANQTTIINHLTGMKGTTWSSETDSLEAIRDRGDAAWITGDGSGDGGTTYTFSVSTLNIGEPPTVNLERQQYEAFGTLAITADSSQEGDDHIMVFYSAADPSTALWRYTTDAGQIAVSGAGYLTITITADDDELDTAGTWLYKLFNISDDACICRGSLTVHPGPEPVPA